jgi:hypothetical protein
MDRTAEAYPKLNKLPVSPAQRQTAAELPWYRTWLLSTGRTEAEVNSTTSQHASPVDAVVAGDAQEQ